MTDDLAAAVRENARLWIANCDCIEPEWEGAKRCGDCHEWQMIVDVCDAYLAREADDAQPVTREWLVSVLGVIGDSYVSDGGYEEGCCWKKHKAHDLPAIRYYGGLRAYYGQFADGRTPLANRGDVRAFLRLVRWPSNETNGGGAAEN